MKTKNKKEYIIPDETLKSLSQSRQRILNGEIKQETTNSTHINKNIFFALAMAALLCIGVVFYPQINSAAKILLGISKNHGIEVAEENNIRINTNLVAKSDDLDIKLTKFIATKNKYAFDYQFEIKDDYLKNLLQKECETNSDNQMIDFGLKYDNGSDTLNNFEGFSSSHFRIEGNTFYGSVVATFYKNSIPDDTTLKLVINSLSWVDEDKIDQDQLVNTEENGIQITEKSALDDATLKYSGNWEFPVNYKPITQTKVPQLSQVKNLKDVKASSDALQTIVKFKLPNGNNITEDINNTEKYYSMKIYKDGKQISDPEQENFTFIDSETGEFRLTLNLSSLDNTSVYKVKVIEEDFSKVGSIKEIGSFEIQNK